MIIEIDKQKAIDMKFKQALLYIFLSVLLTNILINTIFGILGYVLVGFIALFYISFFGTYYLINKTIIKTLEYEINQEELKTSYTLIVKTKNSARLQVVNNVNITQGLWDKIFGFFNLEVDYGFGDSGYTHIFNYLTEEKAEEISKLIKPHSNLGVNIK